MDHQGVQGSQEMAELHCLPGHQQNFIAVCCASAWGFIYIRSVLHPFQQRPSCGREAPERRFYCQMMKAKLWCLLTPSHELATVTPKETCCRETRNLQRRILLTWANVQCNRFRAMKQQMACKKHG